MIIYIWDGGGGGWEVYGGEEEVGGGRWGGGWFMKDFEGTWGDRGAKGDGGVATINQ